MNDNKKYTDVNTNRLVRKSSLIRILTGSSFVTVSCVLYSLGMKQLKNYPIQFSINWFKGSLLFSFNFFLLNEFFYSISKYFEIYSNLWIRSSISAYLLSRIFCKYLIRNSLMRWHTAILFSHKCFASLCVFNIITESCFNTIRYLYLYDEPDVIDFFEKKQDDNIPLTFSELQNSFMKPINIINSEKKLRKLKKFYNENKIKNDGHNSLTFDLYNFYKNEYKTHNK